MLFWDPVNTYGQHWLKLRGIEIALVDSTVDPAWPWSVTVQRQRGIEVKLVGGRAKTLEHAGCERQGDRARGCGPRRLRH